MTSPALRAPTLVWHFPKLAGLRAYGGGYAKSYFSEHILLKPSSSNNLIFCPYNSQQLYTSLDFIQI